MRLYQPGALLTGAPDELIRRGGVLVDGPRIAAAGMYACPTMNVHALALRERSGGALEKVIMGLYPGGAQIVAGTDAGIGNCPHDAYRRPAGTLTLAGPSPR